MKIGFVGVVILLASLLAGCGSSGPNYKSITCSQWVKLASADDATSNGSLGIANDYLDHVPVDPKGGAADVADFGDAMTAGCAGAADSAAVWSIRYQVVAGFLDDHPQDNV